jgi:hypothetical protein
MITPLFIGVEPESPGGAHTGANPIDDHRGDARRRSAARR